MQGLGRPGNELIAAAGMYCIASLFAKRKLSNVSTIDSRSTALVTQVQYCEISPMPEMREWQETGNYMYVTANKPRSEIALVLQYSVPYK